MPTRADRDEPMQGLATSLLTLRITVVLAEDLDGRTPSLDPEQARATLHQTWSRYLEQLHPGLDAEPLPMRAADGSMKPEAFAALAKRARTVHAMVTQGSPPTGGPTEGVEPTGDAPRASAQTPLEPGAEASTKRGMHEGITRRIAHMCERLGEEPQGELQRLEHHLLVSEALALRTDPVLLETEVRITGDVTTRINGAWLEQGDDREQRTRTVLELQRMGVETAVSWWAKLVDLVAGAGRTLIELALKK